MNGCGVVNWRLVATSLSEYELEAERYPMVNIIGELAINSLVNGSQRMKG
jgi:hypothetical protein